MKTKYKFIHFVETEDLSLDIPKMYECINNKSKTVLGYIAHYTVWHEYVFSQADSGIVFNSSCLLDIVDFLNQLNE